MRAYIGEWTHSVGAAVFCLLYDVGSFVRIYRMDGVISLVVVGSPVISTNGRSDRQTDKRTG